eukprot:gene25585-11238_t
MESDAKAAPPSGTPFPKDCKACPGYQNMLDGFRRFSKSSDTSSSDNPGFGASSSTVSSAVPSVRSDDDDTDMPGGPECPPDTGEIGRAAWTFLHTTAAYYPDNPTPKQQGMMKEFVAGLAEFYPCSICAEHLQPNLAQGLT